MFKEIISFRIINGTNKQIIIMEGTYLLQHAAEQKVTKFYSFRVLRPIPRKSWKLSALFPRPNAKGSPCLPTDSNLFSRAGIGMRLILSKDN